MERWENRLRAAALELPYPPTPDIARAVRQKLAEAPQRAAWTLLVATRWKKALIATMLVLVLVACLLSVPSVRAAVIEFLQIGVIRIILPPLTPTPTPTPALSITIAPVRTPSPTRALPPSPTPGDLIALADLQGETTLEDAIQQASFTLHLPAYPPDLGTPDRLFIQGISGTMAILVWTEEDNSEKARLILYEIAPGSWVGEKGALYSVERTRVNRREAIWAEGPYTLYLTDGDLVMRRLIAGHVLIWDEGGVTYRLESNLSLSQAIEIAESLEPIH
jgi:hypothetical protein